MSIYILIPFTGYVGLWLLGGILFIIYFKIFHVTIDLKNTVSMIQQIPSFLSIITVPICSFISFFLSTKIILGKNVGTFGVSRLFKVGIISLLTTIILDVLITVVGEKMDIRKYPVNLMYLFAWLVIVPAVIVAGL